MSIKYDKDIMLTTSSDSTSSWVSSRPSILMEMAIASEVSGVTFRDAINASNVIRPLAIAAVTTRCRMRCCSQKSAKKAA